MKLESKDKSVQKDRFIDIALSLFVAVLLILGFSAGKVKTTENSYEELAHIKGSQEKFGFNLDSVFIEEGIVQKNEFFSGILNNNGISTNLALLIEHEAKNFINLRNIREGAKYHIVKKHECDDHPIGFVYEPDRFNYLVCDLRDKFKVDFVEKHVDICEKSAGGVIESSLWKALDNEGVSPAIIDLMEEALSSSVDFYHTQKGDEFKLIYEEKYIDGEYVGMGKLLAASYAGSNGISYALKYNSCDGEGYFDFEGRPARKTFLKAPVKFTRISSNFNMKRLHPIKGKVVPHLGTDYAAPYGTPIRAVSDGVVTAATYTRGNGYFVKIKHDKVYETQYLHMSRFAKGIKPGTKVKQGETIGYVGATGLATGPHVCFSFWKNGKQVNHLKEKMPPPAKLDNDEITDFYKYRDKVVLILDDIKINKPSDEDDLVLEP